MRPLGAELELQLPPILRAPHCDVCDGDGVDVACLRIQLRAYSSQMADLRPAPSSIPMMDFSVKDELGIENLSSRTERERAAQDVRLSVQDDIR